MHSDARVFGRTFDKKRSFSCNRPFLQPSIVEQELFLFREKGTCLPSLASHSVFFFLPEAAQPLGQHGCASQIISNGAAAIAGEHHHVLGAVRRCRRAPRVQGRPAGGAETARAQILVARHRLAATWKKKNTWRNESITVSAIKDFLSKSSHLRGRIASRQRDL